MKFWLVFALLFVSPAFGQEKTAIDPTENVKALNEAAQKRSDDLRGLESQIGELRYNQLKEMIALRADYEDKLRRAEASRLDALRLVDTNNVSIANERAVATAAALAKRVDDSAQVLNAQLVKSADDVRKTTAEQFSAVTARLGALEQGSAEGLGKQKYQDPVQAALIEEVRKLSRSQSDSAGAGIGRGEILSGIAVVLTLLLAGFVAFRPKGR